MVNSDVVNDLKLFGKKGHEELYLDGEGIPHTRPSASWFARLVRWLTGSYNVTKVAAEAIRYLGKVSTSTQSKDLEEIFKALRPITSGFSDCLANLILGKLERPSPPEIASDVNYQQREIDREIPSVVNYQRRGIARNELVNAHQVNVNLEDLESYYADLKEYASRDKGFKFPLQLVCIKLSQDDETIQEKDLKTIDDLEKLPDSSPQLTWTSEGILPRVTLDTPSLPAHLNALQIAEVKVKNSHLSLAVVEKEFFAVYFLQPGALISPYLHSEKFQRDQLATDFTIGEVGVHRSVLANVSHAVRQCKGKSISDIQMFPAFEKMVDFAYTGKVTITNVEEAFQLLYYADKLQIPDLLSMAASYCKGLEKDVDLSQISENLQQSDSAYVSYLLRFLAERATKKTEAVQAILMRPYTIPGLIPPIFPLGFCAEHSSSDYQIQVGEKMYHVHQAILASRSDYFADYFSGGTSQGDTFIEFRDIIPQHIEWILSYIYKNISPQLESAQSAESFLKWAVYYQFPELKEACFAKIFQERLTENAQPTLCNIGAFLDLATTYGAREWHEAALFQLIQEGRTQLNSLDFDACMRLNELLNLASTNGSVEATGLAIQVQEQIARLIQ